MGFFENSHPGRWVAIPENELIDPTSRFNKLAAWVAIPENELIDPTSKYSKLVTRVAIPENEHPDPARHYVPARSSAIDQPIHFS